MGEFQIILLLKAIKTSIIQTSITKHAPWRYLHVYRKNNQELRNEIWQRTRVKNRNKREKKTDTHNNKFNRKSEWQQTELKKKTQLYMTEKQ